MQDTTMATASDPGAVSEVIWRRKRGLQKRGVGDGELLDAALAIERGVLERAIAGQLPFAAALAGEAERALGAEDWERLERLLTLMAAGGRRARLTLRAVDRTVRDEIAAARRTLGIREAVQAVRILGREPVGEAARRAGGLERRVRENPKDERQQWIALSAVGERRACELVGSTAPAPRPARPARRQPPPQRPSCRSFGEGAPAPFVEQLEAIKTALLGGDGPTTHR